MSSSAAFVWQYQFYKKIHQKLKHLVNEDEEIQLLKSEAEELKTIRKRFLMERFD